MDPIKVIENKFLSELKPINDAIDRGNSTIQKFYRNTTIFVTGGSGFIGKQLVEKLCRSCEIKKIYLLLRAKRGQTSQQRLATLLNDPVYDDIRNRKPQFTDKIVPVEGDIADIRLGLSEPDWAMLTEEVNIIFHVAATVRFDEPIKVATLINVRGTREAIKLARECKNLTCFTHISTAYAHATVSHINGDLEEKFYDCPIRPEDLIEMVETMDDEQLNAAVASAMTDWPNTYTFTKAMAEEVIRTSSDLPRCIVKPPVVISAYLEPAPGWIDDYACWSSAVGFMLGAGLGVLHVQLVKKDMITCSAPVDLVNNAIIAATWDSIQQRQSAKTEVPIYTVSNCESEIKFEHYSTTLRTEETLKLSTPKCVWYGYALETSNTYIYWVLTWLLHYIPGYLVDGLLDLLGLRPKGIPRLVKVYNKVYKISTSYRYFSINHWNIKGDNVKAMITRMSPEDRQIYNCDVSRIDFDHMFKALIVGLRKYIVKDGLRGSDIGYRKQKIFKYVNAVFLAVYAYVIYIVLRTIYSIMVSTANIIFS